MQAQCVRIPIVSGKTQRFVDWMAEVNGRQAEMIASMRVEGVRAEAMFLERSTSGDALVFYMQAEDLERAQQVFAASTFAIDALTRAIIDECWDVGRATRLEVLLELLGPAY